LYGLNPEPGEWSVVVDWLNPVSGLELSEPFTGTIQFNGVNVSSNLPDGGFSRISAGGSKTFNVKVTNTGNAPEAFFLDPRLNQYVTMSLPDQNEVAETGMILPLPLPADGAEPFPYFFVPSQTTQLQGSITGSAPVTFDMEYFPGDPDIAPGINSRWQTTGGIHGDSASVTLTEPEISAGLWSLNPAEEGPFTSPSGAPAVTANANVSVVTKAFDPFITSTTGDFWAAVEGESSTQFAPQWVAPGASTIITVTVSPSAPPGTRVSGNLYVDDYSLASEFNVDLPTADEVAAIPYSYTVSH
jgi:hypothetical protein